MLALQDTPLFFPHKRDTTGYVKAAQFRDLYQKHKCRLFAQNIRNYIGDTSTNKGIIKTALDEPEHFFFYNNGIAAIATKIDESENGVLHLERFSVINGAQTVRSLAKAHVKEPSKTGNATVLVRVSEVSLRRNEAEENFLDNITRFNNTQNAVKASDFRSNDPIQRGLAKKFAQVYREGKQYWYKNKRSGDRDPRKIPVGMEEFAKTIFAFNYGPSDAHGGTSYLFDISANGGYRKIFGLGAEDEVPTSLSDTHFRSLSGIWMICEALRKILEQEKERLSKNATEDDEVTVKHALERRWMFFFVAGEALRQRYRLDNSDLDSEIARLSRPEWLDRSETRTALEKYGKVSAELLVKLYRNAAREQSFTHRNWFRSKGTLEAIRDELKYSSILVEALPPLRKDRV